MDVAVRELKAKLSAYLKRAAAGERITITDRGRVVAMLVPVAGQADLSIGVEEGWLAPASQAQLPAVVRQRAPRPSEDVLAEDRDA